MVFKLLYIARSSCQSGRLVHVCSSFHWRKRTCQRLLQFKENDK